MSKGMTINHISGDKTDNSLSNLEYLSQEDNTVHAYVIGLMPEKVLEAKVDAYKAYEMLEGFYQSEKTVRELSEAFGISAYAVNNILKGRKYSGLFIMFKALNEDDILAKKTARGFSSLTALKVRQILELYYLEEESQGAIAKMHGVSRSSVGMIVAGHRWKDVYNKFMKKNPVEA
jgi:DNA-binding Lrp family transcriptional regulator